MTHVKTRRGKLQDGDDQHHTQLIGWKQSDGFDHAGRKIKGTVFTTQIPKIFPFRKNTTTTQTETLDKDHSSIQTADVGASNLKPLKLFPGGAELQLKLALNNKPNVLSLLHPLIHMKVCSHSSSSSSGWWRPQEYKG